jgi:hypothetical protein
VCSTAVRPIAAPRLRVGGDDGERVGRGLEQQSVHFGFVLVGDGADFRRKSEYNMEVVLLSQKVAVSAPVESVFMEIHISLGG